MRFFFTQPPPDTLKSICFVYRQNVFLKGVICLPINKTDGNIGTGREKPVIERENEISLELL